MTAVVLAAYPFWPNEVAVEAQISLDEPAAAYVDGFDGGATPEMERFLFGSVPVSVFGEIFEGTDADRRAELMWLLHLSGYFSASWLRGEI